MSGPADLLIPEERKHLNAPFVHLRTPGVCHITSLCVDRAYRSQGIGKSLMIEAEACARKAGYRLMSLNVAEDNVGAAKLYESLGYREVKRQYVLVPDALEGHVIHMTRAI